VNHDIQSAVDRLDKLAGDLEMALKHCRTATDHMRKHDVPRFTAHVLALYGHMKMAQENFDRLATTHAEKASLG
jgi:hypothetical protein